VKPGRSTVVFDLGGVLIDWDPRHLYRKMFPGDEAAMERFLAEVCSPAWNIAQDAGRSWAEGIALLTARHPRHAGNIAAFRGRWTEMLGGPIAGSVAILGELRAAGTPLYALTNWSQETFPIAVELYDFLGWFDGIVVSGREGVVKPDPRLYGVLLDRYGLDPDDVVYIDDNAANATAATRLGMYGLHFTDPASLRTDLVGLGLLG
jgi:2-haloacid dehalogenase